MNAMSSPFAESAELVDVLCDRGYEPDEEAPEFIRSDLTFSGAGTVRVVVSDDGVAVHVFDSRMVLRWTSRFTPSVPLSAVVSLMDDAEASAALMEPSNMTVAQRRDSIKER